MRFVVATHGHCFDGLSSAVVFSRLVQELGGSGASFEYRTCGYGAGQIRAEEQLFTGDENAILDYRFSPTPNLTWYFDHHRTAFGSSDDRDAFEARRSSGQFHFDPTYSSCTKLIADVAKSRFGVESPELEPLVAWADVIDSARFPSAAAAVDRREPILQLASVVEHHGDGPFLRAFVPRLCERPLHEVARSPEVTELYRPLAIAQSAFIDRVRTNGVVMGSVVLVDLTDAPLDAAAKFVSYALYPECMYSVTITRSKQHCKISVGYNPWSGRPLDTDISAICARYGGGGHPVVGGISFPSAALEEARRVARSIATELNGEVAGAA